MSVGFKVRICFFHSVDVLAPERLVLQDMGGRCGLTRAVAGSDKELKEQSFHQDILQPHSPEDFTVFTSAPKNRYRY